MAGLDFLLNLRANTQGFDKGINGAKFAVTALVGALAAVGVGLSINELGKAADSYASLTAQIQMATKDTGNFTEAMSGIHQIAIQTNSTLDSTAMLFSRLNTVGKEMGLTQQQALDLTKTVTQAIQMGGSTAEQADSAVTQFIQAMQGGVLRGEEFNSIMEGGYGLAEALAKGLGRSTSELRTMAEAGELTAERVLKALESQKDAIDSTYAQLPTTIGNALQRIQTSWQILIGEMDQASGASAQVAQWLVYVADNLGIVKTFLDDVGEGFVWFGSQLKKVDSGTIDSLKTALVSAYDSIKSLASTIGTLFTATYDVLNTVLSSVFGFTNAWRPAGEEVSGFQKVLDALNVAFAMLNDAFQIIGMGVNFLTGTFYGLATAFYDVQAMLTFGTVREEALRNMNEMSAKSAEYFDRVYSAVDGFESKSINALQEIGKTTEQKEQERIASLETTLNELLKREQDHLEAYRAISNERIRLEQALHEARKNGNQDFVNNALAGLSELDKKEQEYLKQSQDITRAKIEAAQALVDATLLANGKITESELKLLNVKLAVQDLKAEFGDAGKVIVSAMEPASNSVEGVATSASNARKAAQALGIDLDKSLNRISDTFRAGSANVDTFVGSLDRLGVSGEDAAKVTYEAWQKWLETAKSQAEIDLAKSKLEEFGKTGQLSAKQVEMGMRYLDEVNAKLPVNISEVEKAYKQLGITSQEEAKKMADAQMSAFNVIKNSGTASADQVKQALLNMADKIYASGDAAKIAWYESQLGANGLSATIDETGKKSVQSMNEVADAVERVSHRASHDGARGFRDMANAAREMGEEAKHSIEQWNDALTARQQAEAKSKEAGRLDGPKGGEVNSYSKAEIESILKQRGYSDKDAKKYAESLFIQGIDADKSIMNKNMMSANGQYANKAFQDLHSAGLTSNFGTNKINELLAQFTVGSSGTSSSAPEKTVNYNLSLGGQTVNLTGPVGQEDAVNELFNQLESIKKRS